MCTFCLQGWKDEEKTRRLKSMLEEITKDGLAAVTDIALNRLSQGSTDHTEDCDNGVFSSTVGRLSDFGHIRVFSRYPISGTFAE